MLIVGGIAGIRSKLPYREIEHRSVNIDLPLDKCDEPLGSRVANSRMAGWSAIAVGALMVGISILSRGLCGPKPRNQPSIENQPYV
jgi:hypothetical protein